MRLSARNQLKGKLLPHKVSTQVLREGTLENIKRSNPTETRMTARLPSSFSSTAKPHSTARNGPALNQLCRAGTRLVGVKIRDDASLKLFRKSDTPVIRIAYVRDERNAFLWTRGWTPRLQTYVGREVPNPLTIEICQGSAPIETVIGDILALTKLNYNTWF